MTSPTQFEFPDERPITDRPSRSRPASRGFTRFLVAICIGVAGTLAWQSYGEPTKQIIATRAPELGWSPETKQMIASWMQRLGWTRPLVQTTPETVAPKAPAAASLDPERVNQIALDVAALRQTVEQLTAGQDQMKRDIVKMGSTLIDILVKIPEPAASAHKPVPVQPPSWRPPQ